MSFMRIAFITLEYPPHINGGAGEYAFHITRELAKLGHQIVVFTPETSMLESSRNIQKGVEVAEVGIRQDLPFKSLQFWLQLPKAVRDAERKGKFDIVHINGISYGFIKRRLAEAPHVITIHHLVVDAINSSNLSLIERTIDIGSETSVIFPFIERRCIQCADKIIAVSKFTKDRVSEVYGVKPDKVEVICNGVCFDERGYTIEELAEVRKRFGLDNRPIVLFVGRVDDPRKGLDILLRAFRIVLDKIDANLLIVGKGNQRAAKENADTLGISSNIFFTDFINSEDLKKCYHICDIYVSPSRLEGFGLSTLDAMVAGKPVVATDVGAMGELIKNGINGSLIRSEDVLGLSFEILRYLSDKSLIDIVSQKNLDCTLADYEWDKAAKKILASYADIANI